MRCVQQQQQRQRWQPPVEPPRTVAPSIIRQLASESANAGTTVNFSVVAAGGAPLTYHWKRYGADNAGTTLPSYAVLLAQLSDNGRKCSVVVGNGAGSMTSAEATLTVTPVGSVEVLAGAIGGSREHRWRLQPGPLRAWATILWLQTSSTFTSENTSPARLSATR